MTRVIVIDDEDEIREVLKQVFERAGFEVEVASNGSDGKALMRKKRADLVVTDIIMPGKDGVETAYDIRMEFPNTKIIVMSGGGNISEMGYKPDAIMTNAYLASASAVGVDLTLSKPFNRHELIEAAIKLTGHRN